MKPLATLTAAALAAALAPASAPAADSNGGTVYTQQPVTKTPAPSKSPVPKPKPKPKPKPQAISARPQLVAFTVSPTVINPGQAPVVDFTVKGRAPTIRLRLVVSWPGSTNPSRTIELGRRDANAPQQATLDALADPSLPEGQMRIRIAGRDSAGRVLRPGVRLSRDTDLQVRGHVFPLRGVFSYGTDQNKFGAERPGRTHQGQDLLAAEGTPVVAPRSGTVEYVEYQKGGAGWYVVLDGDNEDYDYAFMHLAEGSIPVVKGEHVDQGQRLGSVGSTGSATAGDLHFEVWQGQWWGKGGTAIDPLPFLQQWQQWSPVRAT